MDDLSGQTIKGYELRARIGQGGFGAVYRAHQPRVGREVAIKVILPEYAAHPDFIRRFESEAQIIARLEHPHIVPLYDYWREPDGSAYLVMRFVHGGSARDRLETGPWEVEEVAQLLDQIASALAVAHRSGVVHRDLKPDNILMDPDGNAYLADFGIAKDLSAEVRLTKTGGVVGSPAYLSPEQLKGEPVTPQSDLYAMGVVLYELLAGQHPFPNIPATTMIVKHLQEPLPPLAERRPDLPPALDDVLHRVTAKAPDRRYSNAAALAAAFRAAMAPDPQEGAWDATETLPDAAPFVGLETAIDRKRQPLETPIPEPEPEPPPPMVTLPAAGGARSSRALLALGGLGVVALVVALVVLLVVSSAALPPAEPPSVAGYDMGIVVAYFAIAEGTGLDRAEADALVDQVYTRLVTEIDAFAQEIDLTIGQLGPAEVGRITGETRAERARSAEDAARQHGADIVLYGEISLNDRGLLEVQPEFYVAPEMFSEALEITGSFRLGDEIEVTGLDAPKNTMEVNRALSARTAATAQIFAGLAYYLLEDYDLALEAFEAAASQHDWEATEGREVLYVLLGNTYGRLASVAAQSGDLETARTQMEKAEEAYHQAHEMAPDYSRPYTGLASTAYLAWNLDAQSSDSSDLELLQAALDYLDQAEEAPDAPQEIGIQTKTLFTRLQVYFAMWAYHVADFTPEEMDTIYQAFQDTAEQIIRRYDDGNNPSVQELAAEAYATRGLAAYTDSACDAAIDDFQSAIELSLSSRRQMFFYGWIGDCYKTFNQRESAIDAYKRALALAESLENMPQQQIERYRRLLDELRANS